MAVRDQSACPCSLGKLVTPPGILWEFFRESIPVPTWDKDEGMEPLEGQTLRPKCIQ